MLVSNYYKIYLFKQYFPSIFYMISFAKFFLQTKIYQFITKGMHFLYRG